MDNFDLLLLLMELGVQEEDRSVRYTITEWQRIYDSADKAIRKIDSLEKLLEKQRSLIGGKHTR